jgi:HEAT repeat protein
MTRAIRIACAVAALAALTPAALAQDDPYAGLARYDGQNRTSVAAIEKSVKAAQGKPAQMAAIEAKLAAALKDPAAGFAGKQEVCRILWMVGTARSVPALASLLPDGKLGDVARYALERCPAPEAGAALRSSLAKLKGPALVGVINSVGNRQDPLAVGALTGLAKSADANLAQAAVAALARIATPQAAAALNALPAKGLPGWHGMVAAARSALAGKQPKIGLALASKVLASKAAPEPVRGEALCLLAGSGAPEGLAAALATLKGSSPYLQIVAAELAATVRRPDAVKRYAAAAATVTPDTAVALLAALGTRGDAAAANAALAQLKSSDQNVRTAAIRAAILLDPERAAAPVAQLAASGSGNDKRMAAEWLRQAKGAAAADAIDKLAGSGAADVKAALAGIIAERDGPRAVPTLMANAKGTDTGAAVAALRALAPIASAGQLQGMVGIVTATQDDDVRQSAQDALAAAAGRTSDREAALAPILGAVGGASPQAKGALLSVMAEIGGVAALAELTKGAGSSDAEVRRAAVVALADRWSGSEALPTLLGLAKSEESRSLRVRALRGCIRLIGEKKVDAAERVADLAQAYAMAERPDEKKMALGVLAGCRTAGAMDLAAEALDDEALFAEAADTVIKLASGNGAVSGPVTRAALEKIVAKAQDGGLRDRARKLIQP